MEIEIGRLLTAQAAWKLDQGDFARKEVSMAKIQVADALHKAVDTAIQLCGARGYSKDTPLEWMYRYARQARLVDGASEVHKMVLASAFLGRGHRRSGHEMPRLKSRRIRRPGPAGRLHRRGRGARRVRGARSSALVGRRDPGELAGDGRSRRQAAGTGAAHRCASRVGGQPRPGRGIRDPAAAIAPASRCRSRSGSAATPPCWARTST